MRTFPMPRHRPGRARGFSLVELIIAIVIVTIGATITLRAFVASAKSVQTDMEVETSTLLAQACAEHILSVRQIQTNGWNTAAANNNICTGIGTSGEGGSYGRAVVAAQITGTAGTETAGTCKNGHTCREYVITLTPPTASAVTFRLYTTNY